MSINLYPGQTTAQILSKNVSIFMPINATGLTYDSLGNTGGSTVINGISGNVSITGVGSVTVTTTGSTITVSGSSTGGSSSITTTTVTNVNAIPIWSGTAGAGLLNSLVTIDSAGDMNVSSGTLTLSTATGTNVTIDVSNQFNVIEVGEAFTSLSITPGKTLLGQINTQFSNPTGLVTPVNSGTVSLGTIALPFSSVNATTINQNGVQVLSTGIGIGNVAVSVSNGVITVTGTAFGGASITMPAVTTQSGIAIYSGTTGGGFVNSNILIDNTFGDLIQTANGSDIWMGYTTNNVSQLPTGLTYIPAYNNLLMQEGWINAFGTSGNSAVGANATIDLENRGSGTFNYPELALDRSRFTGNFHPVGVTNYSVSGVSTGDDLGHLGWWGSADISGDYLNGAYIRAVALENYNYTGLNMGTMIQAVTSSIGTSGVRTAVMELKVATTGDGFIGTSTYPIGNIVGSNITGNIIKFTNATGTSETVAVLNFVNATGTNLSLTNQFTAPATPSSGSLSIIDFERANRDQMYFTDKNGNAFSAQPSLSDSQVMTITAQANAVFGAYNCSLNQPTAASTSYSAGFGFMGIMTSTTGLNNGVQVGVSSVSRGSSWGDGFYNAAIFAPTGTTASYTGTTARIFVGMIDQTIATSIGSDNPAGNIAAFQFSSFRGDTNWQFVTKDNSTQNLVNTGFGFSGNSVYKSYIYCSKTNLNNLYYRIENVNMGTFMEGSTTLHLPSSGSAMRPNIGLLSSGITALGVDKMYIERNV
jgi:hypothetical protein